MNDFRVVRVQRAMRIRGVDELLRKQDIPTGGMQDNSTSASKPARVIDAWSLKQLQHKLKNDRSSVSTTDASTATLPSGLFLDPSQGTILALPADAI